MPTLTLGFLQVAVPKLEHTCILAENVSGDQSMMNVMRCNWNASIYGEEILFCEAE